MDGFVFIETTLPGSPLICPSDCFSSRSNGLTSHFYIRLSSCKGYVGDLHSQYFSAYSPFVPSLPKSKNGYVVLEAFESTFFGDVESVGQVSSPFWRSCRDGTVYDCDFNQQLALGMRPRLPETIFDIDSTDGLLGARIATDNHCFG